MNNLNLLGLKKKKKKKKQQLLKIVPQFTAEMAQISQKHV
jgi:hypothetical protein